MPVTTLYAVIAIVVVGVFVCLVGITIQLMLILRDVRASLLPACVRVVQKTQDSLEEIEVTLDDTHQIVHRANRATAAVETIIARITHGTRLTGMTILKRYQRWRNIK